LLLTLAQEQAPERVNGALAPPGRVERLPRRVVARDVEQREQYTIGAYLLVIGVVLWIIAYLTTRNSTDKTVDRDLTTLEE
jgi:hypothetical protein